MGNLICQCNQKDNPCELKVNLFIKKLIEKKEKNDIDIINQKAKAGKANTNVFEDKEDESKDKIFQFYFKNKVKLIQRNFLDYLKIKSSNRNNNQSIKTVDFTEQQVELKYKEDSNSDFQKRNHNKIRHESEYLVIQEKFRMNFQNYSTEAKILNKAYHEKKVKEGFGIQEWKDGTKFIGVFTDDKAKGYGKFSHLEGDNYSGEFLKDRANGYGIYTHSNGGQYQGQWVDDCQEGIGVEKWADNSFYRGEYKKGKKHGYGTYIWSDGSRYEGEWRENCLSGYGIYYFTDLRVYIGEWKNNAMNGFGEFRWTDGKKYNGNYIDDKKEGFGIYYWKEPQIKVYIGFWKNGKHDGVGKYISKDKSKVGLWEKGEKKKWLNDFKEALHYIKEDNKKYFKYFTYDLQEIQKLIRD